MNEWRWDGMTVSEIDCMDDWGRLSDQVIKRLNGWLSSITEKVRGRTDGVRTKASDSGWLNVK